MSTLLEQEQHEQMALQAAQERGEVFDESKTPVPNASTSPGSSLTGTDFAGGSSPATSTGEAEPTVRTNKTPEELAKQQEVDSRSVYVGNVDYKTTPDELEKFFHPCGTINRITILFDRFTGLPKGYAYVEFEDKEAVRKAVSDLGGLEFKGRSVSVVEKRTNLPGFRRGRGRGRFRAFAGRGDRGAGSFGRGRVGGVRRDIDPKDFPAIGKLSVNDKE